MHKVTLPKFDANIANATLGPWHRSEGERVDVGDVLVDVVTDKANFELTAETAGVLRRIVAPEKSEVPLGYIVALIGEPGEPLVDVAAENEQMMKEYRSQAMAPPPAGKGDSPRTATERGTVPIYRATPRARRLAKENGVDLAALAKSLGVEVVTEEHVTKRIEEGRR